MAEDKKKVTPEEEKTASKVDASQGLKRTVSGISGTKTLRVGRVNKKAKKPPTEEGAETPAKTEEVAAVKEEPKAVQPAAPVEKKTEEPVAAPAPKKEAKPAAKEEKPAKVVKEEKEKPQAEEKETKAVKETKVVAEPKETKVEKEEKEVKAPVAKPASEAPKKEAPKSEGPRLSSAVVKHQLPEQLVRHRHLYVRRGREQTVAVTSRVDRDRTADSRTVATVRRAARVKAAHQVRTEDREAVLLADSHRKIRMTMRSTTITGTSRRRAPSRSRIFHRRQQRRRQTSLPVMHMRRAVRSHRRTPRRIIRRTRMPMQTVVPVIRVQTALPVMHLTFFPMMLYLIRCTETTRERRR